MLRYSVLSLLLVGLSTPAGASASETVALTLDAYGGVGASGTAQTFQDPTPEGAEIRVIRVKTQTLPSWTHEETYGEEMFRLQDTYIGAVYTPGSPTWVELEFSYEMGAAGLQETPALAYVKDGLNTLTIESFWNDVQVGEVTLEFEYDGAPEPEAEPEPEPETGCDVSGRGAPSGAAILALGLALGAGRGARWCRRGRLDSM